VRDETRWKLTTTRRQLSLLRAADARLHGRR
jgi:hypothetical protein